MLNGEQADKIERVQRRACKIIFGWDSHYEDLIESGKVESMSARREKLTINFAKKAESNPRFAEWFPRRVYNNSVELRNEQKIEEKFARTDRLKKSPVFYMRRELNKLYNNN